MIEKHPGLVEDLLGLIGSVDPAGGEGQEEALLAPLMELQNSVVPASGPAISDMLVGLARSQPWLCPGLVRVATTRLASIHVMVQVTESALSSARTQVTELAPSVQVPELAEEEF